MLKPRSHHIRVPVLPLERARIQIAAERAGLPIAEYMRRLALGPDDELVPVRGETRHTTISRRA